MVCVLWKHQRGPAAARPLAFRGLRPAGGLLWRKCFRHNTQAVRDNASCASSRRSRARTIKRRFDAKWRAGRYPSIKRYKAAKAKALRRVGTPVPRFQIALDVRTHGRLGLRALDVAATRTLSVALPRRFGPRRGALLDRIVRASALELAHQADNNLKTKIITT